MALADLIKAFSLSESSLRNSSTSTTTQVVGLLSVLAISGSVALFTLGSRLKLTADTDAGEPLKIEGGDGSTTRAGQSEPLERNGEDGLIRAREEASGPLKVNGRDGGKALRMNGQDRGQRSKACRKRVRFADDVVEPRGNGQEYRMRYAQRQQEEGARGSKRQPSNSIPANRMALYKGLRQHRLQHAASFFS